MYNLVEMHNSTECRGPLTPEMVWENSHSQMYKASNALTLEDEDIQFASNSTSNHWIADWLDGLAMTDDLG